MKLNNPTPFDATTLPMLGQKCRPILAVIVKGTFAFANGKIDLAPDQVPIAYGDDFYSKEEGGSIRYESDMVPFKPSTDVVLSGKAYAPDNTPAAAVDVALKVGPVHKQIKVFGRRLWNHAGVLSRRYIATQAKPFVIRPIRYHHAFGGMDTATGEFCKENIDGKGFYTQKTKTKLAGRSLPLIEDPAHLIRTPEDHPKPVGFGFYHRAWQPRAAFAGTYDDAWRVEQSPQPPDDFDFRFYNGAHPDLQAKGFLRGDEPVEMTHLTPEGKTAFHLPGVRPLCRAQRVDETDWEAMPMNLDTVFIEPDKRTLNLVWRCGIALSELSEADIQQVSIEVNTSKHKQ